MGQMAYAIPQDSVAAPAGLPQALPQSYPQQAAQPGAARKPSKVFPRRASS